MNRDEICAELRKALDNFVKVQETCGNRDTIQLASKKVDELCAMLDDLNRQEAA